MREILSSFLANKALENKNFFVLSGDHGYALFDEIRRKAPKQFINTGVAEQAMIGVAAGMAKTGKRVVVYGLSSFVPMRVLEFIKISICYENLPIIILGDGAGVVYSTLGVSHQCGEDIAALRSLPIKIFSPADKVEMGLCLAQAYEEKMPCYIRIGKSDKPIIHKDKEMVVFSSCIPIQQRSSRAAIFATGSMVSTAVALGDRFNVDVYSCPILNFLSEDELLSKIYLYKNIISLEEHSVNGGLGSLIADIIAKNALGVKLTKQGLKTFFTKGCGSYDYAIKSHSLDFDSISAVVEDIIQG